MDIYDQDAQTIKHLRERVVALEAENKSLKEALDKLTGGAEGAKDDDTEKGDQAGDTDGPDGHDSQEGADSQGDVRALDTGDMDQGDTGIEAGSDAVHGGDEQGDEVQT